MYALRRVGLPPLHRAPRQAQWRGPCLTRRSFSVQALSEGFLDLATALPLPPSLPPYSTTIILVTVVSRILITLPVSIWVCHYQVILSMGSLTPHTGCTAAMEAPRHCPADDRKHGSQGATFYCSRNEGKRRNCSAYERLPNCRRKSNVGRKVQENRDRTNV